MMDQMAYITRIIPQPGLDLLSDAGFTIQVNPEDRTLSHDELLRAVSGKHGILCTLADTVDAAVIEAAGPQCRGIASYAVGYNNIDIEAATRRGLPVSNTPGVLTDATADLTWALLMCAARRIVESDALMRSGRWRGWGPMQFLGADIAGATLGIIGAGRIGAAVAKRASGFGMRILYTARSAKPDIESSLGARFTDLDTLLCESDFVSLHVPLTAETRHLIGPRELSLMKQTAILVNTSRGPVIDETALVEALRRRTIFAAALDVYENEPAVAPGLAALPNAVICTHIGSATVGTRTAMALMAAQNLIAMLRGERAPNCVNPQVYQR